MRNKAGERPVFDVFLSHNRKDKPRVRALAALLTEHGIKVWFDEDQLIPGRAWQPLMEEGIRQSRTGAALVGSDGLGPWEDEEMQALLNLAVREKKPVIPVLLPRAPKKPDLPVFLSNRTWVDLRAGFEKEGIDKLIWGITGKKPIRLSMSHSYPLERKLINSGVPSMEEKKKQLLKTIANRLAKGGIKSIPIAGGILEEAIFGVMDAESARKESAKLQLALQRLQDSAEEQTQSLDALLRIARDQADLNRPARDAVDQAVGRISATDAEEQMTAVLETIVARQNIDLSTVPDDVDALQQEIENKIRPEMVTRAALIKKLTRLRQAEIDALVATLGAYGIPAKSKMARASELINWAQRPDGQGIAEIIFAARALELPSFEKAIPDPQ